MSTGRLSLHLSRVCVLSLSAALAFLSTTPSGASETDNFTDRPTDPLELGDHSAEKTLNEKTNELLDQALKNVKGCDLKALHTSVRNALGGGEVGQLEAWAIQNASLKKVTVPYPRSIYADAGLNTGSGGLFLMGIVPSIVVNGHYFGADKLGHFFDQGYDYYEEIYIKHGDSVQAIENLGLDDEDGVNGMKGNGIRSYGDMSANFSGYLFWRQVAAGPHPYFECKDGKYIRTSRSFSWSEYASDAWDEAINCSELSKNVGAAVSKVLSSRHITCPVRPQACQAIADLMCGTTFLSPACLPFVHLKSYPDSACLSLMYADQEAAQSCQYESGILRDDTVKTFLALADGAESVLVLRGKQASNWAKRIGERAAHGIIQQIRELTH